MKSPLQQIKYAISGLPNFRYTSSTRQAQNLMYYNILVYQYTLLSVSNVKGMYLLTLLRERCILL